MLTDNRKYPLGDMFWPTAILTENNPVSHNTHLKLTLTQLCCWVATWLGPSPLTQLCCQGESAVCFCHSWAVLCLLMNHSFIGSYCLGRWSCQHLYPALLLLNGTHAQRGIPKEPRWPRWQFTTLRRRQDWVVGRHMMCRCHSREGGLYTGVVRASSI
jgi:hypothetical protein